MSASPRSPLAYSDSEMADVFEEELSDTETVKDLGAETVDHDKAKELEVTPTEEHVPEDKIEKEMLKTGGHESAIDDQDDVESGSSSSEAETVFMDPLPEEYYQRPLPEPPVTNGPAEPYVYVPVLPHYELRALPTTPPVDLEAFPSMRNMKNGLFATQDIEVGTRIICEPPLIALPYPGDHLNDLIFAFNRLSPSDQQAVMDLNASDTSASEILTDIAAQIDRKSRLFMDVLNNTADFTQEEIDEAYEQMVLVESMAKLWRVAARWHACRHSMTDLPENQRADLPLDTPITGLFIETAKIQHSCVPNCYSSYDVVTKRLSVHAMRFIAKDEQITLSWLPRIYYQTALSRNQELQEKFGLGCVCEACDMFDPMFIKHEKARMRNFSRLVMIEQFLALLDILDSDDALRDMRLTRFDRPDEAPELEELQEVEAAILKLIKDLKLTGCHGGEVIRWYIALIERVQPRIADEFDNKQRVTYWRVMLGHAKTCEKLGLWTFGEDTRHFQELKARREAIEVLIQLSVERARVKRR